MPEWTGLKGGGGGGRRADCWLHPLRVRVIRSRKKSVRKDVHWALDMSHLGYLQDKRKAPVVIPLGVFVVVKYA